jgi:hypothetical protein
LRESEDFFPFPQTPKPIKNLHYLHSVCNIIRKALVLSFESGVGMKANLIAEIFIVWTVFLNLTDVGTSFIIWKCSGIDLYYRNWEGVAMTFVLSLPYWVLLGGIAYAFATKRIDIHLQFRYFLYSLLLVIPSFFIVHVVEFSIKMILCGACTAMFILINIFMHIYFFPKWNKSELLVQ